VLLAQTASADLVEASGEDRELFTEQGSMIDRGRLLRAIRAFNEAASAARSGWQPQLPLELALLEAMKEETVMVAAPMQAAQPFGAPPSQAAPPLAEAPPVEQLPPGAPPVIPLATLLARWVDMLRELGKLNKTGPELVQYFRPVRVEGNLVHLATDNELYFDRLNVPQKLALVEKALTRVHKTGLKVKVIIARDLEALPVMPGQAADAAPQGLAYDPDDPLLALGRELGAEIKPGDERPAE
jgi:hypothetical protein